MTIRRTLPAATSLTSLLIFLAPPQLAHADIFQWEYTNPTQPGQGKQQSTTLAPDGDGAIAAPGADLSSRDLTRAYLAGADLSPAQNCDSEPCSDVLTNLSNTNLTQAYLFDANLKGANFSGANLNGADIRGANLERTYYGNSISLAQLYQTGSYQKRDLTGVNLTWNDLTAANLSGQNLTRANFGNATLLHADLTGAEIHGATFTDSRYPEDVITVAQLYSTASYQNGNLTEINFMGNNFAGVNLTGTNLTGTSFQQVDLTNANLSQADLTNALLYNATLTGANLSGAVVRGAHLSESGITTAQLYSTASYLARDLTGVNFTESWLASVDFVGQNLSDSILMGTYLVGANLRHANLTNSYFSGAWLSDGWGSYLGPGANLTNADLTAADARGADFTNATLTSAKTSNFIQSNGHIAGLGLTSGNSLIVRDYDGNPLASAPTGKLPIVVDEHLTMGSTGTLRFEFDADAWDSTISFAPGISVARGGTLELAFAPETNLTSQVGRTFDLFDWTGVVPTGSFAIESPYGWDLANLYTTGEVKLLTIPGPQGDYNQNGIVDAADYTIWRDNLGGTSLANRGTGIAGPVGSADYNVWKANFGQSLGTGSGIPPAVPEPATCLLCALALGCCPSQWRRRSDFSGQSSIRPARLLNSVSPG